LEAHIVLVLDIQYGLLGLELFAELQVRASAHLEDLLCPKHSPIRGELQLNFFDVQEQDPALVELDLVCLVQDSPAAFPQKIGEAC
jgi:hypothetical protein